MTVIVWDGQTLAADRLLQDHWSVRSTTKIRRLPSRNAIAGTCGDADRGRALLHWLEAGGDFPAHLRTADETAATALVVQADGSVQMFQREPYPIEMGTGPQAIGAGADAAMVAMACGKTAAEAVQLVSQFCIGVGQGMDVLTFAAPPSYAYAGPGGAPPTMFG